MVRKQDRGSAPGGTRPPRWRSASIQVAANGRSRSSPSAGIINPSAIAPSIATPSQKRKSSGRCRKLSTVWANNTVRLKLSTSPPMMRNGRRRLVVDEPPATTTGITGTMHGEMPVMRPPRNATRRSSPMDATSLLTDSHRHSSGSFSLATLPGGLGQDWSPSG